MALMRCCELHGDCNQGRLCPLSEHATRDYYPWSWVDLGVRVLIILAALATVFLIWAAYWIAAGHFNQ